MGPSRVLLPDLTSFAAGLVSCSLLSPPAYSLLLAAPWCVVKVMTKLSFMTPPAAVDLRRENIEYVSVALQAPCHTW